MDEHEKLKEEVIIAAKAWASWCASTDDEWKVALEEAVVALEEFEEGGNDALEQRCRCSVRDNAHGHGFPYSGDPQAFWVSDDCPLHAKENTP